MGEPPTETRRARGPQGEWSDMDLEEGIEEREAGGGKVVSISCHHGEVVDEGGSCDHAILDWHRPTVVAELGKETRPSGGARVRVKARDLVAPSGGYRVFSGVRLPPAAGVAALVRSRPGKGRRRLRGRSL